MSGEELRAALRAVLRDFDHEPPDDYLPEAERIFRAALAAPSTPEPSGECRDSDMARQFGVYDSEQLPTCNFDCDACRAESQS